MLFILRSKFIGGNDFFSKFALCWSDPWSGGNPTGFRSGGVLFMAKKKEDKGDGGKMTVAEAGRRGGEAVRAKYGPDFYAEIGQKGGEAVKEKYGPDFYSEIGQKGGEARRENMGSDGYATMGRRGGEATRAVKQQRAAEGGQKAAK